ncbi:MAG TPA: M24 family metallopeptidase [Vicinamibacterales bacterium]|nr:M24 family metallopeptidase [Vicinamibacterales bacterium]
MWHRLVAPAVLLAALVASFSTIRTRPPGSQPTTSVADPLSPAAVRARVEREWTVKADKMRRYLLPLMRRHGVDLWIVMSRENVPDPVVELFGGLGLTGWYGHRNAYLFYDKGGGDGLEATVIGTHLSQHLKAFYGAIRSYGEEGLKPHLQKYLTERNPKKIAVNQSRTISMGDGLTAELKAYLLDALGPDLGARIVSSEPLLVDYVSVHTPEEDAIEAEAARATWDILKRAFSNQVITPGRTRLMDVHYWITAERKRLNFEFNFPASLDLQRFRDGKVVSLDDADDPVIEKGDVLHVDFGVRQSGLVTDQQKMAYVLRDGESAPPAGLVRAFVDSVKGAQLHAAEVVAGRTGIDIKTRSEAAAKAAGIDLLVYSHVQGYWVHDAGPWTVFDWPERYGVHPREVLQGGEWFSVEFRTRTAVPEWGNQLVSMQREEDAITSKTAPLRYLAGPQTELWIVK